MIEDRIFGPLSFRQFLVVAAGVALLWLINDKLNGQLSQTTAIILSALVVLAALVFIQRLKPVPFTEETLKITKAEMSPEQFSKWIRMRVAMLSSQRAMREAQNMPPDPKLEAVMKMLEAEMAEKGSGAPGTFQ